MSQVVGQMIEVELVPVNGVNLPEDGLQVLDHKLGQLSESGSYEFRLKRFMDDPDGDLQFSEAGHPIALVKVWSDVGVGLMMLKEKLVDYGAECELRKL